MNMWRGKLTRDGSSWPRKVRPAVVAALAGVLVTACSVAAVPGLVETGALTKLTGSSSHDTPEPPLHAEGSELVDSEGEEVRLTGVNWFGFETGTFAPHGLWKRNYQKMLDQMVDSGFNTLRLPYTNELFTPGAKPEGIDYSKNPGLRGLQGRALMDKIVNAATDRGMMVILDRHRPTADAQSELWYTSEVSESQWIKDWKMLARHYQDNPRVIGADLHNEPRGQATWGSGDRSTDWRLAAERAGNAILRVNSDWLVLVEGIESYNNDYYWWGGNLKGAKKDPVRLSDPQQLVYSAHDYGPGVWKQSWFDKPGYPKNLPELWTEHWGYLEKQDIAPVVVGEFGGRSVQPGTPEGKWQRSIVEYMKKNDIGYTYWSWNPNSGDTGGVLKSNWETTHQAKMELLSDYQRPLPPAEQ